MSSNVLETEHTLLRKKKKKKDMIPAIMDSSFGDQVKEGRY